MSNNNDICIGDSCPDPYYNNNITSTSYNPTTINTFRNTTNPPKVITVFVSPINIEGVDDIIVDVTGPTNKKTLRKGDSTVEVIGFTQSLSFIIRINCGGDTRSITNNISWSIIPENRRVLVIRGTTSTIKGNECGASQVWYSHEEIQRIANQNEVAASSIVNYNNTLNRSNSSNSTNINTLNNDNRNSNSFVFLAGYSIKHCGTSIISSVSRHDSQGVKNIPGGQFIRSFVSLTNKVDFVATLSDGNRSISHVFTINIDNVPIMTNKNYFIIYQQTPGCNLVGHWVNQEEANSLL